MIRVRLCRYVYIYMCTPGQGRRGGGAASCERVRRGHRASRARHVLCDGRPPASLEGRGERNMYIQHIRSLYNSTGSWVCCLVGIDVDVDVDVGGL